MDDNTLNTAEIMLKTKEELLALLLLRCIGESRIDRYCQELLENINEINTFLGAGDKRNMEILLTKIKFGTR